MTESEAGGVLLLIYDQINTCNFIPLPSFFSAFVSNVDDYKVSFWLFYAGFTGAMALQKFPCGDAPSVSMKHLNFLSKVHENTLHEDVEPNHAREQDVDVDLREVYFLIMHFLSAGPCRKTCVQFWNELLEHQLLPRRYHAWYSRKGMHSGDENDDGQSFPLNYNMLVPRYMHIFSCFAIALL